MRIALVGYGRMGRTVEELAQAEGHEVVARLDRDDAIGTVALAGAEVAVEFSEPGVAADNLVRLAEAGLDAVCGTTGWQGDLERVSEAVEAAGTGLVHAPNFSIGVALFSRLVCEAARLADAQPEYEVLLHETHHRHKLDHPSGTARSLADIIVDALGRKRRWREEAPDEAADPDTLLVGVTRTGEVPGTHVVSLDGPDDRIELRHEAHGRLGFARGALEAARWIRGRRGVFTLDDLLRDRFGTPPTD